MVVVVVEVQNKEVGAGLWLGRDNIPPAHSTPVRKEVTTGAVGRNSATGGRDGWGQTWVQVVGLSG